MAALNAGFPSAPFVDPAGNVTAVWRAFLLALFSRTGAGVGISSGATAAQLSAEVAIRASSDTSLSDAISNESAARATDMTAEVATRAAADTVLAARIAALGGASNTASLLARMWFG